MSLNKPIKNQIIDQVAHFVAAMIILTPLIAFPSLFTAAIAGFGCGLVREVTSRGTPTKLYNFTDTFKSPSSMLDITFWTIGASVAWMTFS